MQDESDKESQKSAGSAEEDTLQLHTLDDEFFHNMNEKIKQIVDSLEKRELNKYAEEVQVLLTVCNKVRDEWLGNEQKTKNAIEESEEMRLKLKEILGMSRIDKDTIEKLKQEIETAWKQADTAQLREQAAQEKLRKTDEKIEHLENVLQKYSHKVDEFGSFGPEQKENITKERNKLSKELKLLTKRLEQQQLHSKEIEKSNAEMGAKLKELHRVLNNNSVTILNEKKMIENLKKEKSNLQEEVKCMHEKLKTVETKNELCVQNSIQQNLKILAQKANFEHIKIQYNNASAKLTKILSEIENLKYEKDHLTSVMEQKIAHIETLEEENNKLKQEFGDYSKTNETLLKKFQLTEKDKITIENDLIKLRNEFTNMEKETVLMKKSIEILNKNIKQMTDERDTLKKNSIIEKNKINNYEENHKILQHQIKCLNNDINKQKLFDKKQNDDIIKMKTEKDKNIKQTQLLNDKISKLHDEIHYLKNILITDLKRDLEDKQNEIINLHEIVEMIKNEKNLLEQNLMVVIQDKNNLEKQQKTSYENIKNLKEIILKKSAEISKYQGTIDRLEKDQHNMKTEITNLHVIIQTNKCELKEKKQENNKLYKTLADHEMSVKKLKKDLDQYMNEKNLLNTQLIKKNDEILQQNNKIEKLQNDIDCNKLNYEKCLKQIRNLKIEIRNLETQRNILKRNLENTSELRTELVQLQRNFNQELIKSKALEDEMITPLNVHRWRNLGGSDPEKMDLINRNQTLQKTILSQRVKVLQKEDALEHSQKLYRTLKDFMVKLPSYKIQQQLNETQATLSKNTKTIKALVAELNTKETDEKVNNSMVQELRTNLETTKRQLIDEKKKKQQLLEERQIIARMQIQCFSAPLPCTKIAGSGFKMNLIG